MYAKLLTIPHYDPRRTHRREMHGEGPNASSLLLSCTRAELRMWHALELLDEAMHVALDRRDTDGYNLFSRIHGVYKSDHVHIREVMQDFVNEEGRVYRAPTRSELERCMEQIEERARSFRERAHLTYPDTDFTRVYDHMQDNEEKMQRRADERVNRLVAEAQRRMNVESRV